MYLLLLTVYLNAHTCTGLISKGVKSLETFTASSDGSKIAFAGNSGYIHISCGKQRTWCMDLKMNTSVRALRFIDGISLVTSGLDADVYLWDLRYSGRCVRRSVPYMILPSINQCYIQSGESFNLGKNCICMSDFIMKMAAVAIH